MAINQQKIKPKYSVHLEELIKEQRITKKQLAEMIPTTVQTISKACNGVRLTPDKAQRIIELFPQYRLSWLLGYDDFKTDDDISNFEDNVNDIANKMEDLLVRSMRAISHLCGYYILIDENRIELCPAGNKDVNFKPISINHDIFEEFEEDVINFFSLRLSNLVKRGH